MESRKLISQKANFNAEFGYVFRSSAIFYLKQSPVSKFKTTISFLNYWKIKREIQVAIVASVRDLNGRLIRRECLNFSNQSVRNYSPFDGEEFEGSVEIEVLSASNMVIPYAAVMAVYETRDGVSIIHTYGRTYSNHENEEGRTITQGEEGCWTLKDSSTVRSFAVFHNGPTAFAAQNMRLTICNHRGERRRVDIPYGELKPFQTVKIYPSEYVEDLTRFLGEQPGFATLSFHLSQAFTRMLVGHETQNGTDLQVTHSNFNYGVHQTDLITDGEMKAYMYVPSPEGVRKMGVVYPDSERGEYLISSDCGESLRFKSGNAAFFYLPDRQSTFVFQRTDVPGLPTRIVTGLVCSKKTERLSAECSLGVVHHKRPQKKLWWAICAASLKFRSRIFALPLATIYGEFPKNSVISFRLYSGRDQRALEATLGHRDIDRLARGIFVDELFPSALKFLDGEFGYFTLYSEYGGFWCLSSLENEHGSFTIEHGF